MKYFLLISILVLVLFLAGCTPVPRNYPDLSPSMSFKQVDSTSSEGTLHTYWTSTDSASTQFISFSKEDLQRICKEATASGGVQ